MNKKMENVINFIRNILREEGITGMDSLNHCVIFIISRLLTSKLCKRVNIDKKYAFDNVMLDENDEIMGDQQFYEKIQNKRENCLVGQIMVKLGLRNIKFKLEGIKNLKKVYNKLSCRLSSFAVIRKELNVKKLETEYDIIGIIYELHLKTGSGASMRDLGQYYTHRLVIKYMIELCDPSMKNGKIEKILDPTMGTGGFLSMSIKYLNEKYKNINWSENKNNIIGFDIDENVRNLAIINIMLETGELCKDSLLKQDTLREEITCLDNDKKIGKVDVILANEPMGLKNITYNSCCERIKKLNIKGTKAEPLFLQLFMELLEKNGRCATIVPDGMLFNESVLHKNTRKHLVENFNLKKVINLNGDFFMNTGVKTSILYFTNDGKTKETEFVEVTLLKEKIKENTIMKVNYDELKENDYSLFWRKYVVDEGKKIIREIKYEKINEICIINYGTRIKKNEVDAKDDYTEIKYPCYGGGDISFYMNKYNRDCENIVISRFGVSKKCVRLISGKFWLNDSGFTIKPKNSDVLNKNYLGYYCFVVLQEKIYNLSMGACQKNLQMNHFKNISIPIPLLKIQEAIVERLDVITNSIEESKKLIENYKKIMKYYVECETRNVMTQILGKNIKYLPKKNKYKAHDCKQIGKYNFYTSSQDKIMYRDDYEFSDTCIIMGRGGNPSVHLGEKFSVSHDDCYVLICDNVKYIYYWLLNNKDILANGFTGSTIKHISKNYIDNLKIPMMDKNKQNMVVQYCNNISNLINMLNDQIINNEVLKINILNKYLNFNDEKNNENKSDNESESDDKNETLPLDKVDGHLSLSDKEEDNNEEKEEEKEEDNKEIDKDEDDEEYEMTKEDYICVIGHLKYPEDFPIKELCKEYEIPKKEFDIQLNRFKYLKKHPDTDELHKYEKYIYNKYIEKNKRELRKLMN